MNTLNNHRRYYNKSENKKTISKADVVNGMIVNFRYNTGFDKNPLVFVMDTDISSSKDKNSFSGLNLNYLSISDINSFFLRLLSKTEWKYTKKTNMYRVRIKDIGEKSSYASVGGIDPLQIYNSLVKPRLISKINCWRTYKYSKISNFQQIRFDFKIPPLNKIKNLDGNIEIISQRDLYKLLRKGENEN